MHVTHTSRRGCTDHIQFFIAQPRQFPLYTVKFLVRFAF